MNARIETVASVADARIYRRPKAVDLHPASGILAAVGLSLLLWVAVLALLFVA